MRFFPLDAPAVDITDDGEVTVARPSEPASRRFAPRSERRQECGAPAHETTTDRHGTRDAE
jgi:hypothetical protein